MGKMIREGATGGAQKRLCRKSEMERTDWPSPETLMPPTHSRPSLSSAKTLLNVQPHPLIICCECCWQSEVGRGQQEASARGKNLHPGCPFREQVR